jgi:hypothetical protein
VVLATLLTLFPFVGAGLLLIRRPRRFRIWSALGWTEFVATLASGLAGWSVWWSPAPDGTVRWDRTGHLVE